MQLELKNSSAKVCLMENTDIVLILSTIDLVQSWELFIHELWKSGNGRVHYGSDWLASWLWFDLTPVQVISEGLT